MTINGSIIAADLPVNQRYMSEHRLSMSQPKLSISQPNNNIVVKNSAEYNDNFVNSKQSFSLARLTNTTVTSTNEIAVDV